MRIHQEVGFADDRAAARRFCLTQTIEVMHDVPHFPDPQEKINLRQFFFQTSSVSLGQTSCYDQMGAGALLPFLPLGHLEDFIYGFFFCRKDKGAGIDQDDVRLVCLGSDAVAAFCKECGHDLGVNQILRTSQAYDVNISVFQRGIFLASTFLGLTPSDGSNDSFCLHAFDHAGSAVVSDFQVSLYQRD